MLFGIELNILYKTTKTVVFVAALILNLELEG